jgi:hypothetical protein
MFGEKPELITKQCCVCKKMIPLRVDRDDLDRHVKRGIFVQRAFVRRGDGKPYLTSAERELLISAMCGDCWPLLCSSNPLDYN